MVYYMDFLYELKVKFFNIKEKKDHVDYYYVFSTFDSDSLESINPISMKSHQLSEIKEIFNSVVYLKVIFI